MTKVIKFPNFISQRQLFFPQIETQAAWKNFINSDLGYIHQSFPWKELTKLFKPKRSRDNRGKKSIFDTQGKIALMFLKSYSGYSDEKLIDRINSDYFFQLFCGVIIRPGEEIKDEKLPSSIRCELAKHFDPGEFQKILALHWKPFMNDTHAMFVDATCYETDMRYPTNIKLLWECNEWIYNQMKKLCRISNQRQARNKFGEQKSKTLTYQKNKKKTYKKTRKRIGSLLYLLEKLMDQLKEAEKNMGREITMSARYYEKKAIIQIVLRQQKQWYETQVKPKDLIVSVTKNYIRPIVRGKETKRVEFGAKVNKIQVDGISFVEKLSFDAFHEGIRLKQSIYLSRKLFGKCSHLGGDAIYANNVNRKYCTKNNIITSFVKKGKPAKDEEVQKHMRSILSKERATRLEGSFGTEKEHYGLKKIRARAKHTEILWIFFGIHTVNAVNISKRIKSPEEIPKKMAA